MYEKFFYLKENPFNITPDPKFLYLSKKHQEALDLLFFGISQRKGFLLLTGEVGTGKTTICRALLDKLNPRVKGALLINPFLSDGELIKAINDDFGLKVSGSSLKEQLDRLNSFLLEKAGEGGNAVVIIDEAQHLSPKALEMIRLLSNLETEKMKLLQIVLIGQPELREKLKLPELRQLNQRIVVRYHLKALNFEETKAYIFKRLTIAGGKGNIKFTSTALKSIYEASSGIPRLINIVCDRTLTAAFVAGKRIIDDEIEKKAIDELDKDGTLRKDVDIPMKKDWQRYRYMSYISVPAVIIVALFAVWLKDKNPAISPQTEMLPTMETISNSVNPAPPVIKNVVSQALPPNEVKIQESAVSETEVKSASRIESEGNNTLQTSEVALVNKAETTSLKRLIVLVNGNEHAMSNGETLEITQGDKLKIVDAVVDDAASKDVSVNFLGFVGNRSTNTGEDRGYLIDTGKDLWVKYSVKKQGRKYPIIVKYSDKKIGEVFIKIASRP